MNTCTNNMKIVLKYCIAKKLNIDRNEISYQINALALLTYVDGMGCNMESGIRKGGINSISKIDTP